MEQYNYNPEQFDAAPVYDNQFDYPPQEVLYNDPTPEYQATVDAAFNKSLIGLILAYVGITLVGIFFSIAGFKKAKNAFDMATQYGMVLSGKAKAAKIMGLVGIILNIVYTVLIAFFIFYYVFIIGIAILSNINY